MTDSMNAGAGGVLINGESGDLQRPGGSDAIEFRGECKPLAGIIVKNMLLTIITFSIYRFWARTNIRKYYWSNTLLLGDRLEYTGRGGELFVGFLIVMAILVPVSIVYQIIEVFLLTRYPDVGFIVTLVYFVGFIWLIHFAFFRARRYRLTRTVWRGIHAGQTGSGVKYATRALLWGFASILTLGLSVPWGHVALQRYEITNAQFGRTAFGYAGRAREVFRLWWPVLALMGVALVYWGVLIGLNQSIGPSRAAIDNPDPDVSAAAVRAFLEFWAILLAPGLVVWILAIAFMVRFRIALIRYLFNVLSLAGARFESSLSIWRIVGYCTVAFVPLLLVLVSLLIIVFVVANSGTYQLGGLGLPLGLIVFFGFFFLPQLMVHLLFYVPLIRHISGTLTIENAEEVETIVQGVRDDPRFGEGLVDAFSFDVGAI